MPGKEDIKAFLGLDYGMFIKGFQEATKQAAKSSATLADTIERALKKPMKEAGKQTEELTQTVEKGYKSVGRVVQGILISQVFYRTLQAMKDAAAAVFQVAEAAEVANISFSILLNNVPKAQRFLAVLEDFAAVTPFSIQDSRLAAQRLMAMGIQAENTLPILRAVLDASTMTGGGSDTIERISEALGKINTMGRVTQRQMLQLAYAGIPAYAILEEKLGLTKDQLKNLGKLRIPADIAIKALVQGIEERYRRVSEYVSKTVPGLISTVKDDMLLLGKALTAGPYEKFRGFLYALTLDLERLRQVFRKGGIGAVFNDLIPKDMQASVRTYFGNWLIQIALLKDALFQIWQIFKEVLRVFIVFQNALMPLVNGVLTALLALLSVITSNARVLRVFVSVITTLVVLKMAIMLVLTFRTALKSLVIIQTVVKLLYELAKAVVVVTLAMASSGWGLLFIAIGAGLAMLAFNSDAARNSFAKLGSQINSIFGAGNKKIMPVTTDQSVIADQEEFNKNLEVSKESYDDMTDAAEKSKKAAQDVFASFDEVYTLTEKGSSNNNETEAPIDEDLLEAMNMKDWDMPDIKLPDLKMPDTWGIFKGFWKDLWKDLCDSWHDEWTGSVEKTKQSIKNFKEWCHKLKVKIGILIDIAKDFGKDVWKKICDSWNDEWKGSVEKTKQSIEDFKAWCASVQLKVGEIKDNIVDWCSKRYDSFTKWADNTEGKINTWASKTSDKFSKWYDDNKFKLESLLIDTGLKFANWCAGTASDIEKWYNSTKVSFNKWYDETSQKLTDWYNKHKGNFNTWCSETGTKLSTWYTTHKKGLVDWADGTSSSINKWYTDTKRSISDWTSSTGGDLRSWYNTHKKGLIDWCTDSKKALTDWWRDTKVGFGNWAQDLYTKVFSWLDKLGDKFEKLAEKFKFWDNNSSLNIEKTLVVSTKNTSGVSGHAAGGVYSREHYARFAEGNKPEMIVPTGSSADTAKVVSMMLENGLQAALDRIAGGSQQPLYVGTLIADDRSLRELERKMKVIRLSESARVVGG